MKAWLAWTIGLALLIAAWGVVQITPAEDDPQASFPVAATVGEPAVGRAFEVTITDVRLADRATAGGWYADGTWLVVDLEVASRLEETGTLLSYAVLVVGDRTFRASERPESLFGSTLSVGIPRAGSIAFELPADLADHPALLRLGLDVDTRLDSVIELPVELGTLDRQDETELLREDWAQS